MPTVARGECGSFFKKSLKEKSLKKRKEKKEMSDSFLLVHFERMKTAFIFSEVSKYL